MVLRLPPRPTALSTARRLLAAPDCPPSVVPLLHRRFTASVSSSSTPPPLPLRPFLWPGLHIGTDICHIGRVHAILTGPPSPSSSSSPSPTAPSTASTASTARAARFIRRLLSPQEVAALVASASPPPSSSSSPPPLPARTSTHQVLAWLLTGGQPAIDDDDLRLRKAAEFLAGRFAAKEAAIKAHPHLPQKLTFHKIRIVRRQQQPQSPPCLPQQDNYDTSDSPSGPPVALVRIDNGVLDAPFEQEALLSISHDGDYATAVCLGFDSALVGTTRRPL